MLRFRMFVLLGVGDGWVDAVVVGSFWINGGR